MLMCGKLHIEAFGAEFPGETGEGAAQLVAKVRGAVNKRFQNCTARPGILWTDRGKGFYHPSSGKITTKYKAALNRCDLKPMFRDDASIQPGRLQEVMLHETAVSWIRDRLRKSIPPQPWLETPKEYESRLKCCCDYINENFNVDGLCRALPSRVNALVQNKGDRLRQ